MEYDASLLPIGIAAGPIHGRDIRGQGARHARFLPLQWLARAAPRHALIRRPILTSSGTTAISFPLLTEIPMEGSTMNAWIRNFLQEEDGVTALEYGILAAVIAVLIIGFFSNNLRAVFKKIFDTLTGEIPAA